MLPYYRSRVATIINPKRRAVQPCSERPTSFLRTHRHFVQFPCSPCSTGDDSTSAKPIHAQRARHTAGCHYPVRAGDDASEPWLVAVRMSSAVHCSERRHTVPAFPELQFVRCFRRVSHRRCLSDSRDCKIITTFRYRYCVDPYRVVTPVWYERWEMWTKSLRSRRAAAFSKVHEVAFRLIFSASFCALCSPHRGSRFHLSRSALHVQEFPRQCRRRSAWPSHPRVPGRSALCAQESVKCNPAGNAVRGCFRLRMFLGRRKRVLAPSGRIFHCRRLRWWSHTQPHVRGGVQRPHRAH
jgi:hypothetical protein